MKKLLLILMLLLFISPGMPGNEILFCQKVTGGCLGVTVTNNTGWFNFNGSDCSSPLIAYTTATDGTEYPSGSVLGYTASDSTVEIDTANKFQQTCGLEVTSAAGGAEYFSVAESAVDLDPNNFSVGILMKNDSGVTIASTPFLYKVAQNSTNRIYIDHPNANNMGCKRNGNGTALSVTTAGDTDCCGGGGCGGFLSGGFADTWFMFQCEGSNTGGTDSLRILVNGCVVDEDTTNQTSMASWTSAEHTLGTTLAGDTLHDSIAFIGWDVYGYDFSAAVSGGDNTFTDGDECWNRNGD